MNNSVLSKQEMSFINQEIISRQSLNIDITQYRDLDKDTIDVIIEKLSDFIGYDHNTNDIDDTGRFVDGIISKLLVLLEQRGEI